MKRFFLKMYVIIFLSILTLPLLQLYTNIFENDKSIEKRELKTKPTIKTSENLETYITDYEDYFNDNLGFKSELISINSKIDLYAFNKSSNSDVILGKDDYLFFHEEIPDYHKSNLIPIDDIQKIARNLKKFQDNLNKYYNVDLIFSIAPNKSTVYPEFILEESADLISPSNLDSLQKELAKSSVNFIDLKSLMLNNKKNYNLFYKRDTHWNTVASTLAANEYIKYFNKLYNTNHSIDILDYKIGTYDGDLDNLLGFYTKTPEYISKYKLNIDGQKLPKMLSYTDSFGNMVMPMINELFEHNLNMHVLNAPVISNFTTFSKNSNILIFEIVERNLFKLLDYDFEVFNQPKEDIIGDYTTNSIELNHTLNDRLSIIDTSYIKTDKSNFYTSKSEKSTLLLNENFNADYLYLEFNEVNDYTDIYLSWANTNEDFSEEKKLPIMLIPKKNQYTLDLTKLNFKGTKLKLKLSTKANKQLDLKELTFYNKP